MLAVRPVTAIFPVGRRPMLKVKNSLLFNIGLFKIRSMNQISTSASNTPRLDDQLCFALYSTTLAMNKTYRKCLQPFGITYPQYLVLLVLWEQDGLTVNGIGERLFLDSATLTPLLKRMERQNLIGRQRAKHDERQVIITLAEDGEALRARAVTLYESVAGAIGCSKIETTVLSQKLLALRSALLA